MKYDMVFRMGVHVRVESEFPLLITYSSRTRILSQFPKCEFNYARSMYSI